MEIYLRKKKEGQSRHSAIAGAGIEKAHSFNIDRRMVDLTNCAKAIFPGKGDHMLQGLSWIYSVIGKSETPLFDFNRFCLANRVNCIYFSRVNIILFRPTNTGSIISLNNGYSQMGNNDLDSS